MKTNEKKTLLLLIHVHVHTHACLGFLCKEENEIARPKSDDPPKPKRDCKKCRCVAQKGYTVIWLVFVYKSSTLCNSYSLVFKDLWQ